LQPSALRSRTALLRKSRRPALFGRRTPGPARLVYGRPLTDFLLNDVSMQWWTRVLFRHLQDAFEGVLRGFHGAVVFALLLAEGKVVGIRAHFLKLFAFGVVRRPKGAPSLRLNLLHFVGGLGALGLGVKLGRRDGRGCRGVITTLEL